MDPNRPVKLIMTTKRNGRRGRGKPKEKSYITQYSVINLLLI